MPATSPLRVGAVLFPGFELLDIYGPLELLGALGDRVSLQMLAEKHGDVASHQGPRTVIDQTLDEVRGLDILLIPGGMGTRREIDNQPFLELLKARAEEARIVATICTGSALLARTGLLDGHKATSNKLSFEWVRQQGPKVNWIRRARWVEDGKYFTSSGVSAGMDMALGLIEHLFDHATCLQVARRAEYTWQDDKTDDPFADVEGIAK